MKEIGTKLRQNREDKGLSISEVSMATKINAKILKAIEEGDEANLPAKTFLRGFVRSYASYLKMDVTSIMNEFKELVGSTKPEPTPPLDTAPTFSEALPDMSSPKVLKKAAIVGALALTIFAIVITKNIYEKYSLEREAKPTVEATTVPETNTQETTPSSQPDKLVQSPEDLKMGEEAKAKESPKQEQTPSAAPKEEPAAATPVVEAPPESNVTPTASEPKPEENSSAPVADSNDASTEETTETTPPVKTAMEVIIEALDSVEIDYRIDGGELKYTRLKPDQTIILKASQKLAIDLSNAGAVNVTYNGSDRGVPGDIGQSIKLTYP